MSRISDERLRELPVILATKEVMSCGCQTKTNDPDYHDPDCLYRLLCEFAALVSELMESREAKPVAYMDENGALLVPEGSPIKALWDNTPQPEVGKKLIPLYARNALKDKEPGNASE